jgi:hypothetical protein
MDEGSERMAIAGLIGCSPDFGSLGIFDKERLDLLDDDSNRSRLPFICCALPVMEMG